MTEKITREEIEALLKLAEAATPGPWKKGISGNSRVYGPDNAGGYSGLVAHFARWQDRDFIAAANPAVIKALCTLALQAEAMQPRPTHRHIKTGGLYQMLGSGAVQSERPLTDMQAVVIYRSMKDGTLWAREFHEFHDASRFEPLTSLPEPK